LSRSWLTRTCWGLALLLAVACGQSAPESTQMPAPTPSPTVAPQPTPFPPPFEPTPADVTVCNSGCDFRTLQQAIDDQRTAPGAVIALMDPVHTEAGIQLRKDVTIQGLGAGRTILQAHSDSQGAPDRVLVIPEGFRVTMSGLTIRHGNPHDQVRSGGGIANYGTLVLESSTVRDNMANDGAGIFNHGSLTLRRCAIYGNLADREAPMGYECGSGGGIKSGFQATLVMEDCTVQGNTALGKGGGVFVSCEGTTLMQNCSVSGNHAEGPGGGVYVKGIAELLHCTLADNSSKEDGGGLYVRGEATLSSSLLARNLKGDMVIGGEGGYKGTGVLHANAFNWVADGTLDQGFSGDPLLGPLADNGGSTLTLALLPGSPACDRVPASESGLVTDQRGQPRALQTGSRQPVCDIGAFERQP